MIDISAVMTAHREGLLMGPSLRSFAASIAHARAHGLRVEALLTLDRPDQLTRDMVAELDGAAYRVVELDVGCCGLSRNESLALTTGRYLAFLDGDDLWSENWLIEAFAMCVLSPTPMVAHSELNVTFGAARALWLHPDSTDPCFDPSLLQVGNLWDSLAFTPRHVLQATPYRFNDLTAGFGYEDWHWNCETLARGVAHRPVPGTVHFKRRRTGSLLAQSASSDVVVYPTALHRFADPA